MQISVKLHCNQSCKSHRFSIWASSFLCTCLENGVWRRRVGFRERARGRGRAQGGEKDNKRWVWQEGGGYEKHSKKKKRGELWFLIQDWTHFFFLLDLDLKIHTMIKIVQQCETSSAEAFFRLFFWWGGWRGWREGVWWDRGGWTSTARVCELLFTTGRGATDGRRKHAEQRFSSACKRTTWENFSKPRSTVFFFSLSLLLKKYSIKETNPTIITVYTAILSACLGEYKCGDQTLVESKKKKNCRKEQWVPPKRAVLKLSGLYKKGC